MKIAIPLLLIAASLAGLITVGIRELGIPELQVRQVLAGQHSGEHVKIQGRIASIEAAERPIRFTICDKEDASLVVPVVVDAVRPDIFQVGNDVAVEGSYSSAEGSVAGTKIYTKCPSKYEASQEGQVPPGTVPPQPESPRPTAS